MQLVDCHRPQRGNLPDHNPLLAPTNMAGDPPAFPLGQAGADLGTAYPGKWQLLTAVVNNHVICRCTNGSALYRHERTFYPLLVRPRLSKDNLPPLFIQSPDVIDCIGPDDIVCHERLGGLLNHYQRKAARYAVSPLRRHQGVMLASLKREFSIRRE
jgi:hypothetical protein